MSNLVLFRFYEPELDNFVVCGMNQVCFNPICGATVPYPQNLANFGRVCAMVWNLRSVRNVEANVATFHIPHVITLFATVSRFPTVPADASSTFGFPTLLPKVARFD